MIILSLDIGIIGGVRAMMAPAAIAAFGRDRPAALIENAIAIAGASLVFAEL